MTCQSLVINLATRGRPALLLETVRRTLANMASDRTTLLISVDADDALTLAALKSLPDDKRIVPLIAEREDSLGGKYNRCLAHPAGVYLAMVDYAPQITPGFDEKILAAASLFPDGIGVVYNHLANPSFPGINAITKGLADKLGWFYPPYFPYWFVDHWLDDVAKLIDRIAFADVQIDGTKRPGTQGRHEPGFWGTVFDLMAGERNRQAVAIIKSDDFLTPDWQKQMLLGRMPLVEVASRAINDGVRRAQQEPASPEPRYQRIRAAALGKVEAIAQQEYAGEGRALIEGWLAEQRKKAAPRPLARAVEIEEDQEARLKRAQTRSVFIATPIARHPVRQYSRALLQTASLMTQLNIRCWIQNVCGGSNLPRGRNELVAHFLASDYTDLLFIDDDIGWTASDVVRLLASDKDVIGGVYAKKRHGDDREPGKWTMVSLPEFNQDSMGAIEVEGLGTGFLKISRSVFERMIAAHPDWKRNGPPSMSEEVRRGYYHFFRFDPNDPDETGEDIGFCRDYRKIGGQVWADPAIRLSHVGECEFCGDWTAMLERAPAAQAVDRQAAQQQEAGSKSKPMPIRRRQPLLGDQPDYSCAIYPDPPSHDFLVWLTIAELMRRHHNADGPLTVRFGLIKGQLGTVDFSHYGLRSGRAYQCGVSREYYDTMLANVMRPAMAMIGAVEEVPPINLDGPSPLSDLGRYVEYDYHISNLVDAARAGFEIPKWQVPQWAIDEVDAYLHGLKPVVITLRETTAQPERNSQFEEWVKFALSISETIPVLFVRDSAKANDPLPMGLPIYPRAAENAFVRAALYQRALVNLMVGTGPIGWCLFSDAPYIQFKQLVPALPNWGHGHPAGWKEQAHLEVGEQYPWALPTQRLAWADDTFENISREFERFLFDLNKRAAA